ncbi:unnamed protein product [Triticum turgidum subsp. durum]|uniref:PROP1-like PPR domain-containing protein n=1 Tax=Triticum turgidum subsp. durum TaxID=4567 RepID=A0A9R0TNG5_TRITD|nr:unnamed protein product [Triticum turgidum subsp. durum]
MLEARAPLSEATITSLACIVAADVESAYIAFRLLSSMRQKYGLALCLRSYSPVLATFRRAREAGKAYAVEAHMAASAALPDAEKCIELDPTFSKGYIRKGTNQFFMKEYEKAMETYQEGLKHDLSNQELLDGVKRFHQAAPNRCRPFLDIFSRSTRRTEANFTPEELKERQGKSMQDPEIQNILTDHVMRQVSSSSDVCLLLFLEC